VNNRKVKQVLFEGGYQQEGAGIWSKYFIPMDENRTMKLVETVSRRGRREERWGSGRGSEFDRDILYGCVGVSQ
jgi:hypothetical protein